MAYVAHKVGGREVLMSGSVISDGEESIELAFAGGIFEFRFVGSVGDKVSVSADQPTQDRLLISLAGVNNPLGTSVAFRLGEHEGRPVQMRIVVHTLGEKLTEATRLFSYTIAYAGGSAA